MVRAVPDHYGDGYSSATLPQERDLVRHPSRARAPAAFEEESPIMEAETGDTPALFRNDVRQQVARVVLVFSRDVPGEPEHKPSLLSGGYRTEPPR